MIEENLRSIKDRIHAAAVRGNHDPKGITLVAVTKTVPADAVRTAILAGVTHIGESRIQESLGKFGELKDCLPNITTHLIGHLQTNKARKAVELFGVIQSLDSVRLAQEIDRHAAALDKIQECLIEVKVSPEESKFGLTRGQVREFMDQVVTLRNVRLRGIMTMAPYAEDPAKARPYFADAKEIFDSARARSGLRDFDILSMGMSGDFEVAIEEGATMVRIGTALFK